MEDEKPDPAIKAPDLFMAVKNNDTQAALSLMEEGVPPVYVDEANSWTVITWAAKNGNIQLMKKILEIGGSDTYHKYKNGQPLGDDDDKPDFDETTLATNTPLMWASYGGHLRMVWLLLVDGYSPDDTDKMGNSCLHLAASSGHDRILQCLVDDGANPFLSNVYKNRPVDVSSTPACRSILLAAMERYARLDTEARRAMHGENLTMVSILYVSVCVGGGGDGGLALCEYVGC